jgi:hypothetical protein
MVGEAASTDAGIKLAELASTSARKISGRSLLGARLFLPGSPTIGPFLDCRMTEDLGGSLEADVTGKREIE